MEFINSILVHYGASVVSIGVAILLATYYYYHNAYQYFKRLGLKNPDCAPFVGNLWTMLFGDRMEIERKWARECGKFYGTYQGVKPRFVVADADLMRQICIKDFDNFPNHDKSRFLNKYQLRFIFFAQDDNWKHLRALMSPTFTSGKIKRMYKLLNRCSDDLLESFADQLDSSSDAFDKTKAVLNVKNVYDLFTMDGIATCAYGLKLVRNKGSASLKDAASRNEFVKLALRIFNFRILRIFVVFVVPEFILDMFKYRVAPESDVDPLAEKVQRIIGTRRRHLDDNKKFDDYLQILLDAKLDDKMELGEMDKEENHHAGLTHESLIKDQERIVSDVNKLSNSHQVEATKVDANKSFVGQSYGPKMSLDDEDITSSALFLLIVGLETTSSLLTNCTYALAFHQEIQQKLYEEVKKIAEFGESKNDHVFDYDKLTSCHYLDAVISETLRAISPVITLDRVAKQDYYIEKYNITVPKDAKLNLAYYAIMNDPDYWPEPEKFKPDRFLPENRDKIVPGSYCPFGLGPRHCLGMRFSLTEAKLGLAKVVMKYKFEPAPNSSYPPRPKRSLGLNSPLKPMVTVQLRNSDS